MSTEGPERPLERGGGPNRWLAEAGDRSQTYDRRWEELAAAGGNVHGEADLVESLGPRSVLDAGCGTGRVAVELARRGIDVVGVDVDATMLDKARAKAPALRWEEADLATLDLGRTFDVVVLAGNVMIFLAPGTEDAVVTSLARHVAPGGALVAGFSLEPGRLDLATYDRHCAAAGLELADRWGTWERQPFEAGGRYAVSVHRQPG
jgi:SAM-dependent methyltransferase